MGIIFGVEVAANDLAAVGRGVGGATGVDAGKRVGVGAGMAVGICVGESRGARVGMGVWVAAGVPDWPGVKTGVGANTEVGVTVVHAAKPRADNTSIEAQSRGLGTDSAIKGRNKRAAGQSLVPNNATEQVNEPGRPPKLWVRPKVGSFSWRSPALPWSCL